MTARERRYLRRRVRRWMASAPVLAAVFLTAAARAEPDDARRFAPLGITIAVFAKPYTGGDGSGGGGGGGGEPGAYDYLAPIYDLPTGMSYNDETGLVEGTTIDTDYADSLPASEVTISDSGVRSTNRTNVNSAITTAAASGSGTRIRIDNGADCGGSSTLPVNNSSGWIYIEPDAVKDGTFVAEGTTVTASDATNMPKFYQTAVAQQVFTLTAGNGKYRFTGCEFAFAPSGVTWNNDSSATANQEGGLVSFSGASSDPASYPTDIILDRCIIRGISGKNLRRALYLNGVRISIINCLIDEVHSATASGINDGQCLLVSSGPGPYKIHQNMMRCAARGEHILWGGGNSGTIPTDIQVTENTFDYPLAWHGTGLDLKNLYEHKIGNRVLVQGNKFMNYRTTGVGSQYHTFVLKSSDQTGGSYPLSQTHNVTVRLNDFINCGGGIFGLNKVDASGGTDMERIDIHSNRQQVPSTDFSAIARDWPMNASNNFQYFRFFHNTLYGAIRSDVNDSIIMLGNPASNGCNTWILQDNLFAMNTTFTSGNQWLSSDNAQGNNTTLWAYVDGTSGICTGNCITRSITPPAGNTSIASLVAADLDATTLALNPGSPAEGTATNGRDPGAIHALIVTATAGCP